MKITTVRAALAAGLFAAASLIAVEAIAASDSGPKLSKAVQKPIVEAQKLMQANDLKTALDKVHEAQAVPDRTPEDDYVINEFLANIEIGMKDYTAAAVAYEALADSPQLASDPNKATTLKNAIILSGSVKHDAKVIAYGTQLAALGPLDAKTQAAMAISYYNTGDLAHAKDFAQKSIDTAKAAGQAPDQGALQIVVNAQAKTNDEAGAEATLEQLAVQYNRPEDWSQLIDHAFGTKGLRDVDVLYLNRFRTFVGADGSADDYTFGANVALQSGYPGEARSIIEAGIAKGKLTAGGKAGEILGQARAKAASDEKTLGAQIAAGAKGGGQYNAKLAQALYGYGRYADAETAARRAMSGGAKDPTEGPMVLGMAEAQEGKTADALTAFQQVHGGTAVTKAAHFWIIYLQHKASAPTAAH